MNFLREIVVVVTAILLYHLAKEALKLKYPSKQPIFAGFFHPAFRSVAEIFRQNIQNGHDRGSAFAVHHNGEVLIDLWGGWADMEAERPWQENTVTLIWSVVKGAAAVVFAHLVDIGVLDYKKKVQDYWPEFVHKNVTVEMLLSHQAGLIELNKTFSLFDIRDNWKEIESILANATPAWPPGTAVGYHSVTFGLYADALLRKIDPEGRNMSTFFEEEISAPFGIDLSIGLPQAWAFHLARQHFISLWSDWFNWPEIIRLLVHPFFQRSISTLDFSQKVGIMNNVDLLTVGFPSTTGFGNARGIAKLYDYLANNGSVNGQKLLSHKAIAALSEPLTLDLPDLNSADIPFSRGMKVFSSKGHGVFGHTGFGGSIAYADANSGLRVAYLTNHISLLATEFPNPELLQKALNAAFQQYQEKRTQKQRSKRHPVS